MFLSSSRTALYCSCSSSNSGNKDSFANGGDEFVLTTPLYYVNAPPHMGSAYTTIAADAIARFQDADLESTVSHKEFMETSASSSSPFQRTVGENYTVDTNTANTCPKRNNDKSRNSQLIEDFQETLINVDEYMSDTESIYSIISIEAGECKLQVEKDLLKNNCCFTHLKPRVRRKEDNYFFALSKYQQQLEDVLKQNPGFVQPSYRLNEVSKLEYLFGFLSYTPHLIVQGWIKNGLKDFSISRASVDWGIAVPNDSEQTIYVWFDALLGYVSALLGDNELASLETAISSGWPASLHLIGKDILLFHAVYWLAMLMSAGIGLPKMVFGHGFLTKD
ncbi:hypothetical protein K7X08_030280 [Anisodus acutangulus]|uniref:Methionyl/Leucyl tRNA synthetase domain-containing protein n=1 Tax=Anisodus acutangulus TaxID=402998 RepID=A0A9Q1LR04_9SOLA|nr:hypothetical protein K7X08_030280 [Anisodus acutangulus]